MHFEARLPAAAVCYASVGTGLGTDGAGKAKDGAGGTVPERGCPVEQSRLTADEWGSSACSPTSTPAAASR